MTKRHISQSQLAKDTGISQGTISDWKTKGTNPSADKIPVLCAALNVSTDWLLTGEEANTQNTATGDVSGSAFVQGVNKGSVTVHNGREHSISEEAAELLRLYESMDVKKRIQLLSQAFTLAESGKE